MFLDGRQQLAKGQRLQDGSHQGQDGAEKHPVWGASWLVSGTGRGRGLCPEAQQRGQKVRKSRNPTEQRRHDAGHVVEGAWLGEKHSVPGPDVSVFQGGRLGSTIPWVLTAAGVGRALSMARLWGGCHHYS